MSEIPTTLDGITALADAASAELLLNEQIKRERMVRLADSIFDDHCTRVGKEPSEHFRAAFRYGATIGIEAAARVLLLDERPS